jgi:hypothetical protein
MRCEAERPSTQPAWLSPASKICLRQRLAYHAELTRRITAFEVRLTHRITVWKHSGAARLFLPLSAPSSKIPHVSTNLRTCQQQAKYVWDHSESLEFMGYCHDGCIYTRLCIKDCACLESMCLTKAVVPPHLGESQDPLIRLLKSSRAYTLI